MQINPSQEIQQLVQLDYYQIIDYLNKKHGAVPGPYFLDKEMTKKNQAITRTNKGLFIHHVAESLYLNLSSPQQASEYSYEFQLPEELVYCDYIEHLLLHIKILQQWPERKRGGTRVGWGGAFTFLIPTMNDMYSGWRPTKSWQNNCWLAIQNKKDDYLFLVYYLCKIGEFSPELYTSINQKFDLWSNAQNKPLYDQFVALGAPKYNDLTLKDNDRRIKRNGRVQDQTGDKAKKRRPWYLRLWVLIPATLIVLFVVAGLIIKAKIGG